MIYAISDLHGYPLSDFLALLEKAGFSEEDTLFVLGDTIDRGDDGIALLLWMMEQTNVYHLLGNHESMLLSVYETLLQEVSDTSLASLTPQTIQILNTMLYNGARPTLRALRALLRTDRERAEDLLDYLQDMPLCDIVDAGGKTWVMVHSGLGNFAKGKKLDDYDPHDLLWHRPQLSEEYDLGEDVVVLFGHTPTSLYDAPGEIVRTDTWVCIDTGDVAPTLLRLDDGAEFRLS